MHDVDDPRRECIFADLYRERQRVVAEIARLKAILLDIDTIGCCLREGTIDVQCAMDEMRAVGIPILMDNMTTREERAKLVEREFAAAKKKYAASK
jgi:hypothetical protein